MKKTCFVCDLDSAELRSRYLIDPAGLFRAHAVKPERNAKELAVINKIRSRSRLRPRDEIPQRVIMCITCITAIHHHIRDGFAWLDD